MIETLPVSHVDPVVAETPIVPGSFVTKRFYKGSFGTVIATSHSAKEAKVTVLWSAVGESEVDFSKFVRPLTKRTNYGLIAQKLVSIQPMTMPSGLVFYMDYQYGSGSLGSGSK